MTKRIFLRNLVWLLVVLMAAPPWVFSQQSEEERYQFKQEELDQMLSPIALYPDDLLSQILMASTYPLEIVQADRWIKHNKNLKADALTTALEKQEWDPSVKSLVNFPDVLSKMSENLQWTQKLGDAFLAQQEDVMDTVQNLRAKAQEQGNLKTTNEQKVVVQEKVIIIEPATPEVIYVPTYNPTVVYGPWWWPAYPPPPPFFPLPPRPVLYGAMAFGMGVAVGVAWGYAWGHCNWGRPGHHGVNININQNININRNINRNVYAKQYQGGSGKWQHDASHRKGVSYRDQGTAQKFNRGTSKEAVRSREAFRGRAEQGRQDLSRDRGDRSARPGGVQTRDRQTPGSDRKGVSQTRDRQAPGMTRQGPSQSRDRSAFGNKDRGSSVQRQSDRGRQSRMSKPTGGGRSKPSGGGGRGGKRR